MSPTPESHSPARGNGLTQVLSKARRGRNKNNSDTVSVASNGSDGSHGHRGQLEGAMDKSRQGEGSDDDDGDQGTLKKLLPKSITSKKRRKKEEKEAERRTLEEVDRGRSVAERGTLENDSAGSSAREHGDGSSFIPYESENEEITAIPPPLSSHPSHSGYLTTSSPLIHSTTLSEKTQSELQLDGALKALTFPAQHTASLQAPTGGSAKRSPSPVGRLKEAFTLRRATSASPERGPGTGGGFSAEPQNEKNTSFKEGRRGSVVSRIGAIFPGRDQSQEIPPIPPLDLERLSKVKPHVDTNIRPQTPPSGGNIAPVIVNTPPTPTDSGSPNLPFSRERGASDPATTVNVVVAPPGNMISHRRARTNSATLGPSKLSNITSAPLTPTLESAATPPVPAGANQQSGFFSTVFSAAQNAANTLSNSISNNSLASSQTKSRSLNQEASKDIDDVEVETVGEKTESTEGTEQKEPAVKTLGMGDLSLSHLGISETSSGDNTPTASKLPDVEEQRGRPDFARRDQSPANLAMPFPDSTELRPSYLSEDVQSLARPRSVYDARFDGDQTPPNNFTDSKTSIKRSGSIRSAINGRSRRKRGSSATTTGTTIGAAIAAANASVAHPTAQAGTPKLTGFAVASKKRNRDFHQLFRSVPDDDYLIEDYSCALQREILAHGRLYVSEGHLCFSSNIFGWVTTLVMSFDEIVSVEKRSTALVFKNGLMISTLHAKNIFASFTSRDSTYDLIVGIWKLSHPRLRSSLNGVRIDETGGGDKTEKVDGNESQSGSGSEDESEEGEVYDEDDEDEDGMSFTQAGEGSISESDMPEKSLVRKPSAVLLATNGAPTEIAKEDTPTTVAGEFPGPATHSPSQCTDLPTHYDKILADELIPAPLGKTYDLMFGPTSLTWMSNWLTKEQKCLEYTTDDKKGLSNENKVRITSYIKPLNGSIGPRQTKCIVTENLDSMDLERAVSVTMSTQTPDVPSGNVFSTKTKYCLTWGEGNTTRVQMNCAIEWTGKSWLKGPIEKGANDGQLQYAKDIVAALKAATSSRRTATTIPGKTKKKVRKEKSRSLPGETDGASDSKHSVAKEDWGMLEPLHGPLGPVVDIVKPFTTGNMVYGLLLGLLVAAWFSFGYGRGNSRKDVGMGGYYMSSPDRIAAYEEMWRGEESDLWAWLEDRVGLDKVMMETGQTQAIKSADQGKTFDEKLRDAKVDGMSEREIDTAIRVTEEKLKALKRAVERQRVTKASGKGPDGVRPLSDDGPEMGIPGE